MYLNKIYTYSGSLKVKLQHTIDLPSTLFEWCKSQHNCASKSIGRKK